MCVFYMHSYSVRVYRWPLPYTGLISSTTYLYTLHLWIGCSRRWLSPASMLIWKPSGSNVSAWPIRKFITAPHSFSEAFNLVCSLVESFGSRSWQIIHRISFCQDVQHWRSLLRKILSEVCYLFNSILQRNCNLYRSNEIWCSRGLGQSSSHVDGANCKS